MFMKPNMVSDKQGEFIIPVESIMKCEDFKSNFARKLSNRYTSRSSLSGKQDNSLKLVIDPHEFDDNASERIEPCTQLSKSVIKHNGESVKSPDKVAAREPAVRSTEVIALNRAVETLRWQLSQTEANRQMHIALLKQVVSFLNRVKEHIEYKKPETGMRKELPGRLIPGSFSVADLPRSRSVVQVNKNDYSLVSNKKNVSKKISKSISNVNGLKESNAAWNQSKLFLLSEIESKKKITEEMTRLITLANTVLSTHLPDLACNANDIHELTAVTDPDVDNKNQNSDSTCSLNTTDDETTNALILNTMCDSKDTLNGSQDNFIEDKTRTVQDLILNGSPAPDFENEFNIIKNDAKYIKKPLEMKLKSQKFVEKRNDYNLTSNFIEDESGFSSMSSFQEIGIPIISIIPPSPCKDVGYIDDITDMLEDNNNWRNDSKTLDKQAVKVFWV